MVRRARRYLPYHSATPFLNPGHAGTQSEAGPVQCTRVYSICICVVRHGVSVALVPYVACSGVQ